MDSIHAEDSKPFWSVEESSAQIMSVRNYTFAVSYTFITWRLIKHKNNFIFYPIRII